MADTLQTAWTDGARLGIRCAACDHRAVLGPAELTTIRRGNMTRLRDLKLRCGHCSFSGHAPDQFALYPEAHNQPIRRPRKNPLFVVFCLMFAVSPSSAEL